MPKLDPALWRDMMGYLRRRHAPICRQWFDELEPVELASGLLQVHIPDAVRQNYLQKKCLDQFTEAAQAVTGALVAVRFVTNPPRNGSHGPAVPAPGGGGGASGGTTRPIMTDGAPARPAASRPEPYTDAARGHAPIDFSADQIVISPDYSFETFITGPNNNLAYAAAVAVANQPGTAYNPLFIHGGVGLGKTHLLQAVCQQIMQQRPDKQILYVSCDAFMNQFIECVQSGLMHEFRHRYRHVDVLVIDDIHFLGHGSRERSQEEFFHTFNELYQSNRQIVLSSDAAPTEIPNLEERLVSRFGWGLVANVSRPHYETRVAILKAKARLRGIEIPDEVINYIATRVDSNARELEGAFVTVHGHAALQNKAIDLPLARQALGDSGGEGRTSQVTLQQIIDAVTQYYNVRLADLQSRRRHKSVTEPRQVCMWLARKRTRFSLEEIGGYFGGRDHTTVMHSIRTVDDRMSTDRTFAREVEQLDGQIASPSEAAGGHRSSD
jgi:chromosomal replication initiator protein